MKGKIGCLLVIVVLALLWGGGQGLYTAITNLKPHECTVREYIATRPAAKWLRLTGGEINMLQTNYTSAWGVGPVSEIYIPVKPEDATSKEGVFILLATKDPALLALAEKMRGMKSEKEAVSFIFAHRNELIVKRPVQGVIRYGVDLRDKEERKLRKLNPDLAENFIILDEGERPALLVSALMFLGGLAAVIFFIKSIASTPAPPSETPPPIPPTPPPVPGA